MQQEWLKKIDWELINMMDNLRKIQKRQVLHNEKKHEI